jgi:cytochrome c oxidase subunit 2
MTTGETQPTEQPAEMQHPVAGGPGRAPIWHFAAVGVLIAVVTILVAALLENLPLLPVAASREAGPIDGLFALHFRVIAFLFALILVFLFYSVIVFRRRDGELGDGDHFHGHTGLEIAWTILPLITVLYVAYIGSQVLAETQRIDPQALEVKVTGQQWSWRFDYPAQGVTSGELHLPKDRQVLLRLTSLDVIHSFWVPEFRVKQDALPGEQLVKELRVTPTLAGQYKLRCAELCGTNHSGMESPVIVEDAAAFDQWIADQLELSNDPVARGERWSTQYGCVACHTTDGSPGVGPTWQGLYGKVETFEDGSTATVDEAYLHESIVDPNVRIVQGFRPVMPPNFGQILTEEQISDLIEYVKSLQ